MPSLENPCPEWESSEGVEIFSFGADRPGILVFGMNQFPAIFFLQIAQAKMVGGHLIEMSQKQVVDQRSAGGTDQGYGLSDHFLGNNNIETRQDFCNELN